MIFLAFNILTSGVAFSMVCAVIGLAAAFFLIAAVVRSPSGNQRMREISGAVQEGAKAYLNRQVITISSIAVIIFILLFVFKVLFLSAPNAAKGCGAHLAPQRSGITFGGNFWTIF